MGQPMLHEQAAVGEPCRRCGIPCVRETARVPCFEEGDTFETWKERQPAELFKALFKPPVVERTLDIDNAKKEIFRVLMRLFTVRVLSEGDRHLEVDALASGLSLLVVAHLQGSMIEAEKLSARVSELEALSAASKQTHRIDG